MKWVVTAFLILLPFAGCGYSTKSRTAKDIKSVAVPFFENRTPEPNLEIDVTERIVLNIIADNTLKIEDEDNADAVLEGAIIDFANRPFSFNEELDAEEYRVVVLVQATLYKRITNEPIWENKRFTGDGSYFIEATEPGFRFIDALDESIKEITDRILNMIVQDW